MIKIGKIITLSGIDGSGKSTCAKIIKDYFMQKGEKAIVIDAMKNGVFTVGLKQYSKNNGRSYRKCFSADLVNLAWTADLIHNYETKVKNLLSDGYNVILHRSELCCKVYSHVFAPQNEFIDIILDSYDFTYDISIFLDIDPLRAYERIIKRTASADITEKETLENLYIADRLYREILKDRKYEKICFINSDMPEENLVQDLQELLKNKGV